MSKAFYAGSFDPFTVGHMSIVERSLALFDKIYIGVGVNINKPDAEQEAQSRVDAIRRAVDGLGDKVEVLSYSGLTYVKAKEAGAEYLLRGLRNSSDFLYEQQLADVNRRMSGIETVFMMSLPEHASVSSSVVRELERYGADVSGFVAAKKQN